MQQQRTIRARQLKAASVQQCGFCRIAQVGHARTYPHIKSKTQGRETLQELKNSHTKSELFDAVVKNI
jgi:chromodomain-helicase-DNA-binding protein 4